MIFASKKTSDDMRWNYEGQKKDGMLRHPTYGEAWKAFDAHFLDFAFNPHNISFNHFRTTSTNYST